MTTWQIEHRSDREYSDQDAGQVVVMTPHGQTIAASFDRPLLAAMTACVLDQHADTEGATA